MSELLERLTTALADRYAALGMMMRLGMVLAPKAD
jgi:hypothetical protein